MDKQEAWDYLVENSIATEEELNLITGIHGYTLENLNDVHEYRTGESLPEDDECEHEDSFTDDDGDVVCDDCGEVI